MTAARINYVADPGNRSVSFVFDAEWTGVTKVPTVVDIFDARPLAAELSLDREGFVLTRLVHGVTDYADPVQLSERWIPAVQEAVRTATGARWVVCWAPNSRISKPVEGQALTVSAPARTVHSDLAPEFDPARIGDEPGSTDAAAEMQRRLGGRAPKRWRAYNIWQAISAPPQDVPLAFCRLDTVGEADILEGHGTDGSAQSHDFPLTFFERNPAHRWHYFSDMTPGEAVIFSAFDPEAGPVHARVPHTAFDPLEPVAGAVPRSSIEIRAIAVFDDA